MKIALTHQPRCEQVILTLPAHDVLCRYGVEHDDAATLTVVYAEEHARAVGRVLTLLDTLFDHGVTSPDELRLILTATGHTPTAPAPNSTPRPSGE